MNNDMIALLSSALGDSWEGSRAPDFAACIPLAQAHGLSGMLYYALPQIPLELHPDKEIRDFLKKAAYISAARDAIQDRELRELGEAFFRESLAVLPLKGYEIKKLYPKPEMRHMSDTDLLIDPMQAEAVRRCLEKLGYRTDRYDNGSTDIYTSPSGLRYEVHRSVKEEGFHEPARCFLKKLLSYAVPDETDGGLLRLPYEEHYAYMLCHFAKHLLYGGIGVRQVMDVYICRKNWCFDEEKLKKRLEQLELSAFAETLERLANSWFGDAEGNAVTEELGEYILGSGVFGKEEQKVADRMLKKKHRNKLSYAFARLFPGYQTMSAYYPVLKKIPVLLPVFWVWRMIYALIFRSRKLRTEISTLNDTDQSTLDERAAFYQRCGLNVYSEQTQKG